MYKTRWKARVAEEDIGKRGQFAGEKSIDTLKSFACKAVTL